MSIADLAAALSVLVLSPGRPRRIALMNGPGATRKYTDAPARHILNHDDLTDHLNGRRTWAATLLDKDRMARAGCRDYDGDGGQGEILGLLALNRAKAVGLSAAAIILGGRAHVWAFYAKPAPVADIAAQLKAVLPAGAGEIYPSGNNIRLPFGLHRIKGTRGVLVLQDGRRFTLDDPTEREAGLRTLLSLARNAAPPVALAAGRVQSEDSNSTIAVDMTRYDGCSEAHGALLWASKRLQVIIAASDHLQAIARGKRVTVPRDGVPDDSDSAQLAALVYGLIRAHRKGAKPGVGALPEKEIRSIALFLRSQLRPDVTPTKYRWQIEYEIDRYRPEHYAPAPTTHLPGTPSPAPAHLPPSLTKRAGRPVGALLHRLERCAELLPEDTVFTRATLADALTTTVKSVGRYLTTLRTDYGLVTKRCRRSETLRVLVAPKLKDNNCLRPPDAVDNVTAPTELKDNNCLRRPDAVEPVYAAAHGAELKDNNTAGPPLASELKDNNCLRRPDAVEPVYAAARDAELKDNKAKGHYAPFEALESHRVCMGGTPAPPGPPAASSVPPQIAARTVSVGLVSAHEQQQQQQHGSSGFLPAPVVSADMIAAMVAMLPADWREALVYAEARGVDLSAIPGPTRRNDDRRSRWYVARCILNVQQIDTLVVSSPVDLPAVGEAPESEAHGFQGFWTGPEPEVGQDTSRRPACPLSQHRQRRCLTPLSRCLSAISTDGRRVARRLE
jgi:hypothetical protein